MPDEAIDVIGAVAALQRAMDQLLVGRLRATQLRMQTITLSNAVEDALAGGFQRPEARRSLIKLEVILRRIDRWCARNSSCTKPQPWFTRAVVYIFRFRRGSYNARAMEKLRDALDKWLSGSQIMSPVAARSHSSHDLDAVFTAERAAAEDRHLEITQSLGQAYIPERGWASITARSDLTSSGRQEPLVLRGRLRLNDGPDPYEVITVYRAMTIVYERDQKSRVARVILESPALEPQDHITVVDSECLRDRFFVNRTKSNTKRDIKTGAFIVADPSEAQVDSFSAQCRYNLTHWISCILFGTTIQVIVSTHFPPPDLLTFPLTDMTSWVKLSFGEGMRTQAKSWFNFLYAIHNKPLKEATPPPSVNVTVVTRTPGLTWLMGGEIMTRLLAGQGMRSMHSSAAFDTAQNDMETLRLLEPFKRFYGMRIDSLTETNSGEVQAHWRYSQGVLLGQGHQPSQQYRTSRIQNVSSEVLRQIFTMTRNGRARLDVEQRELYSSPDDAAKWFQFELHELLSRYEQGRDYGTSSISNVELPSPPPCHELYVTPHELWRMVREAGHRHRREHPLLFIDLRHPEDHDAARMMSNTVNIDPRILARFGEFKPHWIPDLNRPVAPDELLRKNEELCLRMVQAIRTHLAPNPAALRMFDAKHLYKHIVVYDYASTRFPPYVHDRRSTSRQRTHQEELVLNNLYGAISDGPWKGSVRPDTPQYMLQRRPMLLVGGWEAWEQEIGPKGIVSNGMLS